MTVTIPGLAIKVDLDTAGVEKGLGDIKKQINAGLGFVGITSAVGLAKDAFGGLQRAISAVDGVMTRFIATADKLGRLKDIGEQLGMGIGELVGLNRGARYNGSDGDTLQSAIMKMRGNLGDAMGGGSNPFAPLGLSLKKLSAMGTSGQLGKVFDALNKINDPSRRFAMGNDIFGEKLFKSIELLSRGGSAGLKTFISDAERLGIVLDQGVVNRLDHAGDTLEDINEQFSAISDKVMSAFVPGIERASDSVSKMIVAMSGEGGSLDRFVARLEAVVGVSEKIANSADRNGMFAVGGPLGQLMSATGMSNEGLFSKAVRWSPVGLFAEGMAQLFGVPENENAILESNKLDKELRKAQMERPMSGILPNGQSGSVGIPGLSGGKIGRAIDYPGALEMGTSAAYKAAYEREQGGREVEKVVENTNKANEFLKKMTSDIGKIATAGGTIVRRAFR